MAKGDTKIQGLSILHRLLIAFLSVFIVVCSALTTTYYLFSRSSISSYANEAVFRELEGINETFRNTIQETLIRELKLLSANPLLDEFLMSSESTQDINARALERLFLQKIKYFAGIERIRFVDSRGMDKVVVGQQGRMRDYRSFRESKLFVDLEASPPGSIIHTGLSADQDGDYLFSIGIPKIDPDIGEFGGAVIIDYNLGDFFAFARAIKIFAENPVWIFSADGQVLTSASGQDILDPRPFSIQSAPSKINVSTPQGGLVASSDLAIGDNSPLLKVCISIPEALLYQDVQRVLRFLAIVFMVSFCLVIIAAFFVSKYLSLPLVKLADSVQKLSHEEFSEQIAITATGEVGMLVDSFNAMALDLRKTTVSKDYVDRIFQTMTNSLIVLDAEGQIETVNAATLALLGFQEDELIGEPFSRIIQEALFTELKKHAHINKRETFYRGKNGREYPVLFSSSVMYGKKGEFQAVVCQALDLSDKKQVEQEKELLEIRLRQAHKMEAIGTLAGGIAHDFNNILVGVIGYAEMAELSNIEGQPAVEEIREVIKGGMRARDLVRQILSFSRKDQHEIISLAPYTIVKEVLKLLRSTIPSSIEIKEDIDTSIGAILADPMKIHQVVMNLCTNAVQAMDTGKGILTVTLVQEHLQEEDLLGEPGAIPGEYVVLSVSDTGRGIEPEVKDRIFDPFFTTKEVGSGTGMGLAVVHGIVAEYGGLIRVTSDPDTGTCFRIYFPVIDKEVDPVDGGDIDLIGGSERILIVDDEKIVLEIMLKRLEYLGYDVTACNSGAEAVAVFKNNPDTFDLILTDQTMPHMLGTEMIREILEIRPEMPVILCSGYSSNVSEETSKDFGIKIYLEKPVDFEVLSQSIRKALSKTEEHLLKKKD
ncbi:MAG: response regulator [Proteobacteria bacterium]|nr:response regulator [Pseudomonadota bacterium]MBU1640339.1 response regulator [Pseudomonadota bacterium]